MPTVVFVIAHMGAGGAQVVLARIATLLVKSGRARVWIVTYGGPGTEARVLGPSIGRVAIAQVKTPRVFGPLAALVRIAKLRKVLKELRPDVVMGLICPTNIMTIVAAAGLPSRVVISERNDPERQSFGPVWNLLRRRVYRFADVVSANSEGAVHALRAYVPGQKLVFLPNFIPEVVQPRLSESGRKVVLAIGRLTDQKGFDVLLDGFADAFAEHTDWQLKIIGDGPRFNELREQVVRLNLVNEVSLPGHVADPESAYQEAGIFVISSRHEGTPNVLLEAMAHGLPVIVTEEVAANIGFLRDGHNAQFVPTGDSMALASALSLLMGQREQREGLGAAAAVSIGMLESSQIEDAWFKALGLPASGHEQGGPSNG